MPQVIITPQATYGLERCKNFLLNISNDAARRAGQVIEQQFLLLESNPNIGRPFDDIPELRELIIPFGDSGYISLYRYRPIEDIVYILNFRHQKEVDYQP